jgi:hypothetical protein
MSDFLNHFRTPPLPLILDIIYARSLTVFFWISGRRNSCCTKSCFTIWRFFFTSVIVTSLGTFINFGDLIQWFDQSHRIYASVQIGFLFAPLLFSLSVCALNWTNSSSSRWEFLWQFPGVQLIKHFQLWIKLRQTLNEKDNFSNVDFIDKMKNSNLDNIQQWEISDIEQCLQESLQPKYIY